MNNLEQLLLEDNDMFFYLRTHSNYVKILYRYPQELPNFIDEYKVVMKKTWGDNVEKIGQIAAMAQMFI